jgi:hypothetical protein
MLIQDPKREFYLMREIVTISTDASLTGYGGFVEGGRIVAGKWKEIEQKKQINFLELKGVKYLLEQIVELIKGKYIKISIDNTVASNYMKKGYGKIEELNTLANKIWI